MSLDSFAYRLAHTQEGFKGSSDSIFPVQDFFFWLGAVVIEGPAWVFVFTGSGQPTVTSEIHTKEPLHVLYWNRPHVLFGDPQVIPALMRVGGIQVFQGNLPFQELLGQRKEQAAFDVDAFVKAITDQGKK